MQLQTRAIGRRQEFKMAADVKKNLLQNKGIVYIKTSYKM